MIQWIAIGFGFLIICDDLVLVSLGLFFILLIIFIGNNMICYDCFDLFVRDDISSWIFEAIFLS